MRTHFRFLTKALPDSVAPIILIAFGLPLSVIIARLFSQHLTEPGKLAIFMYALSGMLASTILGAFGYYVPKCIRTQTSFVTFGLWVLLCLSLSAAAYLLYDSIGFALGTAGAVASLLVLVVYFQIAGIWVAVFLPKGPGVVPEGIDVFVRGILYTFFIFGTITALVVPAIAIAGVSLEKTLTAGTTLELVAFLCWGSAAAAVAVKEGQ